MAKTPKVKTVKVSNTVLRPPLMAELSRRAVVKTQISWEAARLALLFFTAVFASGLALTAAMKAPAYLLYTYREATSAVTTGGRTKRYASLPGGRAVCQAPRPAPLTETHYRGARPFGVGRGAARHSVGSWMAHVHAALYEPSRLAATAAAPQGQGPPARASMRGLGSTFENIHVELAQNAAEAVAQPLRRRLRNWVALVLALDLGLEGATLTAARDRVLTVVDKLTKAKVKADADIIKAAEAAEAAKAATKAAAKAAAKAADATEDAVDATNNAADADATNEAAAKPEPVRAADRAQGAVPEAFRAAVAAAAAGRDDPPPDLAQLNPWAALEALAQREGWSTAAPAATVRRSRSARIVALPAATREAIDEKGRRLFSLLPFPFSEEEARATPMPYMAVGHTFNIIFESRAYKAVRQSSSEPRWCMHHHGCIYADRSIGACMPGSKRCRMGTGPYGGSRACTQAELAQNGPGVPVTEHKEKKKCRPGPERREREKSSKEKKTFAEIAATEGASPTTEVSPSWGSVIDRSIRRMQAAS